MRMARYMLGLALLVAASLYLLPALQAADEPALDSPEVTELLTEARSHALQLRDDADEMRAFGMSGQVSWETHADRINSIKEHTNKLGNILQQLSDRYEWSSPWQKKAIDRITPLAAELASNIETTIDHINKNQERLQMSTYRDYLSSNYEVASSLSGLISDYVSYGKNKAKFESLGSGLKVPGH